jgi:hypothetical protein
MIRIYSNTSLHWSSIQLIRWISPKHPVSMMNLYIYEIKSVNPTYIHTLSPLEPLQIKRKYDRYHPFGWKQRDKADMTTYSLPSTPLIYLPSSAKEGDIIVVEDKECPKQPEVFLLGLMFVL